LCTADDIKQVVDMLRHATVAFPEKADLAIAKVELERVMEKTRVQDYAKHVEDVLSKVRAPSDVDDHMAELLEIAEKYDLKNMPSDTLSKLYLVHDVVVEFACQSFPDKSVFEATRVSGELALHFSDMAAAGSKQHLQTPLVECMSLKGCRDALDEAGCNGEGDMRVFDVTTLDMKLPGIPLLLVLVAKVGESIKDLEKTKGCEDIVTKMMAELVAASRMQTEIGERQRATLMLTVQPLMAKLEDVKGGLTGGVHWLDGLDQSKHNDWKAFFPYAQKTIMLEKACAGIKKQLDAFGEVFRYLTPVFNDIWKHYNIFQFGPMKSIIE
jgi:hypothetical protein